MKVKQTFTKFVKKVRVWWKGTPIKTALKQVPQSLPKDRFKDYAEPGPGPITKLYNQHNCTSFEQAKQQQSKFIKN